MTAKCDLCSHLCDLEEGQVGVCKVRANKDGQIALLTWGMVSTAIIDPVEQRPFYHYLPGSKCLSVGGLGCNMACSYCQNFQISQTGKGEHKIVQPSELIDIALNKGVPAIAFTYSEPLVWFEYVYETFKLAKQAGLKTLLKTNGMCNPDKFKQMITVIDAVNIDIKGDDHFYKNICGVDSVAVDSIWKNLEYACRTIHTECSYIVPHNGFEHSLTIFCFLKRTIENFESVPIHLLRFIPDFKMRDVLPTDLKELENLQAEMLKREFKHVYTQFAGLENVTKCVKCNGELIKRVGTKILYNAIQGQNCPICSWPHGIELCDTTTNVLPAS